MSAAKQEASIPQQKEWAERAARANNVQLVAEFQDDGIPGSDMERPGLARLLAWCAGHDVEAIVCWDADRLSRADSIKTAAVLNILMQSGVTRILTHEGWIDLEDDVDRLLFHIKQDMSRAAYAKSMSKNVTRSAIQRAKMGLWVAGRPPYAYRIGEDGHLVLGDPALVEVVRWIFRHYATTADSCGDLCRKLAAMGAPPPPPRHRKGRSWGGTWYRGFIVRLLANRAYLGEIVWNFSGQGKYSRIAAGEVARVKRQGQRRLVRNDPEDWIVRPDAHPALVDPETFAACQKKLAETCRGGPRTRNTPQAGGGDWVLSGLLYCGHCGGRMTGLTEKQSYKGKKYVYRHYVCKASQSRGAGACRKNAVKQETVLRQVAQLIQQSFTDPERLALLRAEVEHKASLQEKDHEAEGRRLRAAIAELEVHIEQGNRNLARLPPDLLDGVIASVRKWKDERDLLARELAKLEAAAEVQADYAKDVAEALEQVRHLEEIIREAPPHAVRDALAGLVERITLHFDYGPAYKNGNRRSILTSLEVQLREEATGLLGGKLKQFARSRV
jgi:site-specific DNA recombinase